jgi:amidohydrolase
MLKDTCHKIKQEIIEWRRDFHRHPELSFQEQRTAKVIADFLKASHLEVKENVNGYGVVADLVGANDGPMIAFRADMDALPIQEEVSSSYSSIVANVMHACGHDGHMASLMGAVRVLSENREKVKGTIRFIFQPAEELTPGGAKGMIEEGVLDGVEAIYGLHLWSELPTGQFRTTYGPMMAASDKFEIRISGKGGHGGMPHKTVDALLVASEIVTSAQHIVSRNVDPLDSGVVSFGKIYSGDAFNVIANKATLEGTVRSLAPEVRDLLENRLKETAEHVASLYGAKSEILYQRGYPALINDEKEAAFIMDAAVEVFGQENVRIMKPNMAGEDFAYYLKEIPGAFCFVGAGNQNEEIYPHHHPQFSLDENALPLATELICRIALK